MKASSPRHLVLCEGKEDRLVMMALASHLGILDRFQFRSFAETGSLRSFLKTVKSLPDFTDGTIKSILVTRDADNDYDAAWRSVSDGIRDVFEADLAKPGEWSTLPNNRRVAGWVIPGPNSSGMIETLLLNAQRERSTEIFKCVDSVMECAAKVHGETLHEKARFHIWTILAQEPGAKDRLSLEFVLKRIPPDWDSEHFRELSKVLSSVPTE